MHSQPPVSDIIEEVAGDFERSTAIATKAGVAIESIVLDIGIGFGKTLEQNLELLAKLDTIAGTFPGNALLVGVSRKSFIGKVLGGASADERLNGSLAAAVVAVMNGARIIRAHDVKAAVDALKITNAIIDQS
jgi:dihydropteroate synthase